MTDRKNNIKVPCFNEEMLQYLSLLFTAHWSKWPCELIESEREMKSYRVPEKQDARNICSLAVITPLETSNKTKRSF